MTDIIVTMNLRGYTDDGLVTLASRVRRERLRRAGDQRSCALCAAEFLARRGARYCSGRCRTAAYRLRKTRAA